MAADVQAVAEFYATARGAVAARLLRERLALLWPSVAGLDVLGIGYPVPYLRPWREAARRCLAAVPVHLGVSRWPAGKPNLTCTVEEDQLPFPDLSFDRVILVHGLEASEHSRKLMREIWRVLREDGRLLVVAPNRAGMWAHLETTPFGQGQPYSASQIGRLLAEALFRIERRDAALYMPPLRARLTLRSARLFERSGRRFLPGCAGVTITEAVKDVYAAMPLRSAPSRRIVLSEAA